MQAADWRGFLRLNGARIQGPCDFGNADLGMGMSAAEAEIEGLVLHGCTIRGVINVPGLIVAGPVILHGCIARGLGVGTGRPTILPVKSRKGC